MTDLIERAEGVTNAIGYVLNVPHDPEMHRHVRRFGFEYEMFPTSMRGECDYDPDDDVDEDDVWSDSHSPCNCQECLDERISAEIERRRIASNGASGSRLARLAYQHDLTSDESRHEYHCRCGSCSHDRSGPLMTAQYDSSCGAEFVSKILDLDAFDHDRRDIARWVGLIEWWAADGGWMPDGATSNGNHVHVSKAGDDDRPFTGHEQNLAYQHIDGLYAALDWSAVADGGCGRIRGYNAKPGKDGGGSWLSDRGYGTIEHRLWNTPADPARLWAHLGISVALTRWAFALVDARPGFEMWQSGGDYRRSMPDDIWRGLQYNIDLVIEQVSSYIPEHVEFDIARDIITRLRPMGA